LSILHVVPLPSTPSAARRLLRHFGSFTAVRPNGGICFTKRIALNYVVHLMSHPKHCHLDPLLPDPMTAHFLPSRSSSPSTPSTARRAVRHFNPLDRRSPERRHLFHVVRHLFLFFVLSRLSPTLTCQSAYDLAADCDRTPRRRSSALSVSPNADIGCHHVRHLLSTDKHKLDRAVASIALWLLILFPFSPPVSLFHSCPLP